MHKILLGLLCMVSFKISALEWDLQFENDHVSVVKAKILPREEIGLHRDPLPRVIIALKGGSLTRMEQNGEIRELTFPTGTPVYLEADPEGEFHKSVSKSDDDIEAIIILLKDKQ